MKSRFVGHRFLKQAIE